MNGESAQPRESPIIVPATAVPQVRALLGGSVKQTVASHLLTMIVGGAVAFIGAWYTVQDKVQQSERRIEQLEANTVSREQFKMMYDTIIQQNRDTNERLGRIESGIMGQRLQK